MKIKICGITNSEDALFCEKCGADMLGFVFYDKSKRFIEYRTAERIIGELSPATQKIGVFVNESADTINKIAHDLNLSAVQLHGDETPETVRKINYPVIKSFRVKEGFDFSVLNNFHTAQPLLDTFTKEYYGGSGRTFNWEMIPEELKGKIILAGGISASNITDIYSSVKPYAVDLSSSLEREPGKKDKAKVLDFFSLTKKFYKD